MGASSTKIYSFSDDGGTEFDGSIYTGAGEVPMLVQDYPFVIWENGNKLSE